MMASLIHTAHTTPWTWLEVSRGVIYGQKLMALTLSRHMMIPPSSDRIEAIVRPRIECWKGQMADFISKSCPEYSREEIEADVQESVIECTIKWAKVIVPIFYYLGRAAIWQHVLSIGMRQAHAFGLVKQEASWRLLTGAALGCCFIEASVAACSVFDAFVLSRFSRASCSIGMLQKLVIFIPKTVAAVELYRVCRWGPKHPILAGATLSGAGLFAAIGLCPTNRVLRQIYKANSYTSIGWGLIKGSWRERIGLCLALLETGNMS